MVFLTPLATGPTCHPLQRYLPLIFPRDASGNGGRCLTSPPSPGSMPKLAELLPQRLRCPAPCELADDTTSERTAGLSRCCRASTTRLRA
jgi:hypothetical protein